MGEGRLELVTRVILCCNDIIEKLSLACLGGSWWGGFLFLIVNVVWEWCGGNQ